jgi:hypothetical protein
MQARQASRDFFTRRLLAHVLAITPRQLKAATLAPSYIPPFCSRKALAFCCSTDGRNISPSFPPPA